MESVYFQKVDAFFNIKSFKDDLNLLFPHAETSKFLTFVGIKQYDIYRGEDRFETKYEDYKKYAKYFIKADKTRTIIERKCQKFSEFVASISSILSAILLFLHFIIDWIDYSFAMKNIIDTLCDEQKKLLKKLILLKKTLIQEQHLNDVQESELAGKIVDSKIKLCPFYQSTILDELNRKNIRIKLPNNINQNNYNINNHCFSLKASNCKNINSEGKTNEKFEIESQYGDKLKIKNLCKLSDKSPPKPIDIKNNLIKNEQIKINKIGCYEIKFKTRRKISILNNIIKKSIIKFYLFNIFPFCRKKQKNVINNNEIFLEKSLQLLIKRLDIFGYLKRIDQLETFFQMIFKQSDLNLFNNFSGFNLNDISFQEGIFRNFDNYNEQIYTDKFRNYYIQLLNNPVKTILEERLENLIQKEMNEL